MARMSIYGDGADAIADILKTVYRIDVAKADNPLEPDGFDRIVTSLTRSLANVTRVDEAAALKTALQRLDVDWAALNPLARQRVVDAARAALQEGADKALPKVRERFKVVGSRTIRETRKASVRKFSLAIDVSLSERDRRAEQYVATSPANFVRDQYGRLIEAASERARAVVARGLAEGVGRADIAQRLQDELGDRIVRGTNYWETVAGQYVNQARTFSLLNSFSDAGIERYVWESVIDEATTEECRFFHGQEFTVAGGVAAMEAVLAASEQDPESVTTVNPWVREGIDATGQRALYVDRGGVREVLARVLESGAGQRDGVGRYGDAVSTSRLEAAGIPWPPIHGKCRSTIIPRV